MIFPFRLIESPNRYAMHLPADIPATTLAEAAKVMEQQFGEPAQATLDGDLIELHHGLENRMRRGSPRAGLVPQC